MKALESHARSGRILSVRRALLCLAAGAIAGLLVAVWAVELSTRLGVAHRLASGRRRD